MALEKTVLTKEKIIDLLNINYGIKVLSVKKITAQTANCYIIFDGVMRYFLKEFSSWKSIENLYLEEQLANFLSTKKFPVTRFISTFSNQVFFVYQGHFISLQEYVEGETYNNGLPLKMLNNTAHILGKLHNVLQGYKLSEIMGKYWINSYSPQLLMAKYEALTVLAENSPDDVNCEQIISDLDYKKGLVQRFTDYKKYFDGIKYSASHGDFHNGQLIWDGDNVKAVIDFESAGIVPIAWEIIRSYSISFSRNLDANIDIEGLCQYCYEYMKYFPLTKNDLSAMPYIYLFQLMRSEYGYPQYFLSDFETKDQLLRFAFWKTKMCREIELKAKEISKALENLV